jgi:putative two-component system response regulator
MEKVAPKRVLIVEEQQCSRSLLSEYVALLGATPIEVADGLEALSEIHAYPPDLVILDLRIPRLDGMSVLRRLRQTPEFHKLPIVVVSGMVELDKIHECIALGAIDFLPKPFKPRVLQSRIENYLRRRRYVPTVGRPELIPRDFARQVVTALRFLQASPSGSEQNWSDVLFQILEQYNPETRAHLERVTAYCATLLYQLQQNSIPTHRVDDQFIERLTQTASLHDIGKLGIPDHVLSKPGSLDPDEYHVMRRHVTLGAEILRELKTMFPDDQRIDMAIELTLYHHERWDGTGYPFGLSGGNIPLAGRIMALADVYDALTSERSYKGVFSHQKSREIILSGAGSQFDPVLVSTFLKCEEEFERISRDTAPSAKWNGGSGCSWDQTIRSLQSACCSKSS